MDVTTETLSPTRVRLSVTVPFEELEPAIAAAYKKIGAQVTVPGFRKGRIPASLIDQRVGRGQVLSEAVDEALPSFYTQAIEDEKVAVLSRPEVEVTGFGDGEPLVFTAEVDIRPDFELPGYDALVVSVEDADVSDADVEENITSARERVAELIGVERPATTGDLVTISLRTTVGDGDDAVEVDGAQATSIPHEVGGEGLGEAIDAPLNRALLGASPGTPIEFDVELQAGEHADKTAHVTVTLEEVKERKLPELDDAFAQKQGYDTVDAMRTAITQQLTRAKKLQQGISARDAALGQLVDAADVPLPEAAVSSEVEALEHQVVHQLNHDEDLLARYLDSVGKTRESWTAELREQAEQSVRMQLVLDAVAEKEEISVTQEDLTGQVLRRAMSAGISPDQYVQQLVENEAVPALALEVRRGKALAFVLEKATVTDASGRPVDLEALSQDAPGLLEGSEIDDEEFDEDDD